MGSALIFLSQAAHTLGITTQTLSRSKLGLIVPVEHVDAVVIEYFLVAELIGKKVFVSEDPEQVFKLPRFCPERHINSDATFCMFWEGDTNYQIDNSDSALRWLLILMDFLRLQRRSAKRREWPSADVWAHGDAAHYQKITERAAHSLGIRYVKALKKNALRSERLSSEGFKIHYRDEALYSVWLSAHKFKRPPWRKEFCSTLQSENGKLYKCGSLENQDAALLAENLWRWQLKEKQFWLRMKAKKLECCQTLHTCPLRC